jgi:hypothetical protein
MGGGGNSPATIRCRNSRPDKPRAASTSTRGSSQSTVNVRFNSFWVIGFFWPARGNAGRRRLCGGQSGENEKKRDAQIECESAYLPS